MLAMSCSQDEASTDLFQLLYVPVASPSLYENHDIYLFNFPGTSGNTSSDLNYVLDLQAHHHDSSDQRLQLQYRNVVPGQGAGWSLQFLNGITLT